MLPSGWEDVPVTPRAGAEPSLNKWLGELLGPAASLVADLLRDDDSVAATIGAEELGWQPIDLLAVLGRGLEESLGVLVNRLLDVARPGEPLRVSLAARPDWPNGARSFLEVAPLLDSAWELVTRGRPATAHDYVLEETATDGAGGEERIDAAELDARAGRALAALRAVGVRLIAILSGGAQSDAAILRSNPAAYLASAPVAAVRAIPDPDALWADREVLRAAIVDAAAFGVPVDAPDWNAPRDAVLKGLLERCEGAFVEVAGRVVRGEAAVGGVAVLKAVFGQDFPALPHVFLRNAADLSAAIAADVTPDDDPGLEGWLHGVAAVRDGTGRLARVLVLGDAFDAQVPSATPVQLPVVAGEPWLGAELPAGAQPPGDRLSLVIYGADALDLAAGTGVGILVDQWTEVIASSSEVTGLAIHYDQPDAAPPQALLLAVPPRRDGSWRWEDLVDTLHETLELAKNRAVELEHLQYDLYGQLLPGVVGELVPQALNTAAEIPGSRVILDLGVNNLPVTEPP